MRRGEVGIAGQQGVNFGPEGIDQAGARWSLARRRLVETQCSGHRVARAARAQCDGAAAHFFDFVQATDLRPEGDVHGSLRAASEEDGEAISRNKSPNRNSPWPGAAWRHVRRGGNERI